MSKIEAILNCHFSFKCPNQWDKLELTADASRRFCRSCERSVYFLNSNEELKKAYMNGLCVAAYIFDPVIAEPVLLLGEPEFLSCHIYLEPMRLLSVDQLKVLQSIVEEEMNLLQVRRRFATGEREIVRLNIPQHMAEEYIKQATQVGLLVIMQ
jgi:hypothetical protein